jgi:hypothetical protein
MVIGFTGTRKGMTHIQKVILTEKLLRLQGVSLHHGDCIGADCECHDIAQELGLAIFSHPANIKGLRAFCQCPSYPPKPPLERNHDIVDCSDLLFAAPDGPEKLRSGTWTTIRYARGKIPIHIIFPDGSTTVENPD